MEIQFCRREYKDTRNNNMVVNIKDLYITIYSFKDICVFPFLKEPINFLKQNYNYNNALEVIAFIEIKYVRPGA